MILLNTPGDILRCDGHRIEWCSGLIASFLITEHMCPWFPFPVGISVSGSARAESPGAPPELSQCLVSADLHTDQFQASCPLGIYSSAVTPALKVMADVQALRYKYVSGVSCRKQQSEERCQPPGIFISELWGQKCPLGHQDHQSLTVLS